MSNSISINLKFTAKRNGAVIDGGKMFMRNGTFLSGGKIHYEAGSDVAKIGRANVLMSS
jgi:hypothetical protein